MKRVFIIITSLIPALSALALEPNVKDPALLEAIHQMRMKQEQHETVVRIIQQPMPLQQGSSCSPAQLTRHRLQQIGKSVKGENQNVNIVAGHGEVNIDNNEGNVNSSVNVQIVNSNEKKCL